MELTTLGLWAVIAGVLLGLGIELMLSGRPRAVRHASGFALTAASGLLIVYIVGALSAGQSAPRPGVVEPAATPTAKVAAPSPPAVSPGPREASLPSASPAALEPTPSPRPDKIPALPPGGFACPSQAEAERLIGVDLNKLASEPCAFSNWETYDPARGLLTIVCPMGAKAELGIGAGYGVTTICSGQARAVGSFTIRFPAAYPSWDSIHDDCAWWSNADQYARWQSGGTYRLHPEGFSCDLAAGR